MSRGDLLNQHTGLLKDLCEIVMKYTILGDDECLFYMLTMMNPALLSITHPEPSIAVASEGHIRKMDAKAEPMNLAKGITSEINANEYRINITHTIGKSYTFIFKMYYEIPSKTFSKNHFNIRWNVHVIYLNENDPNEFELLSEDLKQSFMDFYHMVNKGTLTPHYNFIWQFGIVPTFESYIKDCLIKPMRKILF